MRKQHKEKVEKRSFQESMHSIALASTTIYGWCVTQLVYNTMLLFSN